MKSTLTVKYTVLKQKIVLLNIVNIFNHEKSHTWAH